MTKWIFLLTIVFIGSTSAQQNKNMNINQASTIDLFPYMDRNGLFGYVDEKQQIYIKPQYKDASLFDHNGYAVVTNNENEDAVIDKSNTIIVPYVNEFIELVTLDDYTLAKVMDSYDANYRFWEWRFLPGLNLLGGGSNDKRLFDTDVVRLRETLFLLGKKNRKMASITRSIENRSINLKTHPLTNNQFLLEGNLYTIGKNGPKKLASNIIQKIDSNTFLQQGAGFIRIIDHNGIPISKDKYKAVKALELKTEDTIASLDLDKEMYLRITNPFQDQKGNIFIDPDFSKSLPKQVNDHTLSKGITTADILNRVRNIRAIPHSNYFLFLGNFGESQHLYLDTEGNWHDTLPDSVSLTIVNNINEIKWPKANHYISSKDIPEGYQVYTIERSGSSDYYMIRLRNEEKQQLAGVWDFGAKQWLIPPKFYQIYSLGNDFMKWRYSLEKNGTWGIVDQKGTVLIEPTYPSISTDGRVQLKEDGKYISFYLHLPTLKELREL